MNKAHKFELRDCDRTEEEEEEEERNTIRDDNWVRVRMVCVFVRAR